MGNKTVYCHFSFRSPKDKSYGIFAVAFYRDFEGKKLITYKTKKLELWEDQQFIKAIQSFANALTVIHKYQGMMLSAGVRQVMLVTDNSILAGWIKNPEKRKEYTKYLKRAFKPYRVGEVKEIVLGVGLCAPRKAEKSYKYCREDKVSNTTQSEFSSNKLKINNYVSVFDIME